MNDWDDDEDDATVSEGMQEAAEVTCPYCGEVVEITLDPGGAPVQDYVEDCEVCCRPWHVHVEFHEDGTAAVGVEPEDEQDSE